MSFTEECLKNSYTKPNRLSIQDKIQQKKAVDNSIVKAPCTGGYNVFVKNDGNDEEYLEIFRMTLEERLDTVAFHTRNSKHKVLRTEYNGRTFIIKFDRQKPKYLENRVWLALAGSFYSTQMKAVNKAINNGCTVVPDIYLVAEKKKGFGWKESFLIMEYVANAGAITADDIKKRGDEALRAIKELHRHNLALGDCNSSNLLFTKQGIKFIDLSWQGASFVGKAQDIFSFKKRYGIVIPMENPLVKAAMLYLLIKKKFHTRRALENDQTVTEAAPATRR